MGFYEEVIVLRFMESVLKTAFGVGLGIFLGTIGVDVVKFAWGQFLGWWIKRRIQKEQDEFKRELALTSKDRRDRFTDAVWDKSEATSRMVGRRF